jgi:hypothetical protein
VSSARDEILGRVAGVQLGQSHRDRRWLGQPRQDVVDRGQPLRGLRDANAGNRADELVAAVSVPHACDRSPPLAATAPSVR